MSIEAIIKEISDDITDVIGTQFSYATTSDVPNTSDPNLSYERGKQKSGKILNTCVLYVDIRNSVALNDTHKPITMGKIYTAFTKAVIKAAREHGGKTRNIIGDRVMIVFPKANCFQNAIKCAITINHIAKYILNAKFKGVDFKCGIGIDYGELKVIKVGIQRNGTEGPVNKGLVWAGFPANIASRLTDMGNKTIKEVHYNVLRNPINPRAIRPYFYNTFPSYYPDYDPHAPLYLTTTEIVQMTEIEFLNSFSPYRDGTGYITTDGKMISFNKVESDYTFPPILITEAVYKGLLSEVPKAPFAVNYWSEIKHRIKDVSGKVYGADMHWQF